MGWRIPWTGDSHEKAKHKMINCLPFTLWAFLMAETIKNLPAAQETRV